MCCAASQRPLHPVLQTWSSFSFSAVCQESAHANRQGCGQIKAYGKVVFIWISNVSPSCCFPLGGQSMPSLPGLRQFGADCLQSAKLRLFSWMFWCMILENQRQDLSSWTPESGGSCDHCCYLTCKKMPSRSSVSPVAGNYMSRLDLQPGHDDKIYCLLFRSGFWLALEQIKAGWNQLELCSLLLCSFLAVWMDMEHCSWHCLCAACWRSFKGKLRSPRRAFASEKFLVFYLTDFYWSVLLFCSGFQSCSWGLDHLFELN